MDNTSKASVKILFNPNFGKVHINPDFVRAKAPEYIHVNPSFLAQLGTLPVIQERYQSSKYIKTNLTDTRSKAISHEVEATSNNASYSSGVFMKVGSRKLIRKLSASNNSLPTVREGVNTKANSKRSVYKLDRRIPACGKKQHISLAKYPQSGNIGKNIHSVKKVNSHRNQAIADNRKGYYLVNKQVKTKNKCVLNINGVLYKSSKTKLEKKSVVSPIVLSEIWKRKTTIQPKVMNGNTNFFNLKNTGLTQCGHIGIYAANRYTSRSYLSAAKQKSIVFLSKHLTKSNVPCPIYRKVGKCAAHERGRCPKVHDKKHVAVCAKFVKGECTIDKCLLSHDVNLSKMPTCKFFLLGCCTRTGCPYLHKKLNDNAGVCGEFLKGYCNLGAACIRRHEFVNADASGRGKGAEMLQPSTFKVNKPEPNSFSKCLQKETAIDLKHAKEKFRKDSLSKIKNGPEHSCPRYFQDTLGERPDTAVAKGNISAPSRLETCSEKLTYKSYTGKRPKLGDLPAFIPL